MEVFRKIRTARELLGLTQKQMAIKAGVLQKDISLIESGKRSFIPNRYFSFLDQNGIDLNSLFDNSESAGFRINFHGSEGNLKGNLKGNLNASLIKNYDDNSSVSILSEGSTPEIIKLPEIILPGLKGSFNAFKQNTSEMLPLISPGDWLICSELEDSANIIDDMVYIVVSAIGTTCARLFNMGGGDRFALKYDSPASKTTLQSFADVFAIYKAEARISYNFQTVDIMGDISELDRIQSEFKDLQARLDSLSK